MKLFLIFLWFVHFSCEKEPIKKPEVITPKDTLVSWTLNIDLLNLENELQLNPVIYKEWIILGFSSDYNNRNIPTIVAFNKKSGKKEWEFKHPIWPTDDTRNMIAKDNYLVVKYKDGILCLNLINRQIFWQHEFSDNVTSDYPIHVYGEFVYITEDYYQDIGDFPFNDSISLVRYNILNGNREKIYGEWRPNKDNHPILHPPAIVFSGGKELAIFVRQYLNSSERPPVDLLAVDVNSKEIVWKDLAFSPYRSAWNTPPYSINGYLIAASDWTMYSWDIAFGAIKWQTELTALKKQAGFSFSGPFLHGDRIYAVENDGIVFCLNAETGKLLWQNTGDGVNTNGPARGPCNRPIVVGNILFINTWSDQALVLIDVHDGSVIKKFTDAKYNGTNVLYDEETETFFVMADDKLRAFKINK